MRLVERVRIFTGGDVGKLEVEFNEWVRAEEDARVNVPILSNHPFQVIERKMVIRNYEGEETYALAIFYKHAELADTEVGPDKADPGVTGTSIFGQQKKRR